MYSLSNIAVVVRDLARHPQGALLAEDLRHVLALDRAALAELDRRRLPAADVVRRERLAEHLSVQPRALSVLSAARDAAEVAGWAAWSSALPLLDSAPMGGCEELLAWLRDDLLAHAWERRGDVAVARHPVALDVVADGLLAAWAGPDAGADAALGAQWRAWTEEHSPATVTDPAVRQVVALVRRADPLALQAAGSMLLRARAGGWSWADAMHEACWALEVTGRARTAAVGQLEALGALLAVTGPAPRPAVVSVVTAAVHAVAAGDVLPADTVSTMCRPLITHLR